MSARDPKLSSAGWQREKQMPGWPSARYISITTRSMRALLSAKKQLTGAGNFGEGKRRLWVVAQFEENGLQMELNLIYSLLARF
jgi:hypothetical protein